jgi:hypothetical protein
MVKNTVDIESALRPLNTLSKILGLAHFSGYKNSLRGKTKREENREWEIANVMWCVVVICMVVTGFVFTMISVHLFSLLIFLRLLYVYFRFQ